MGRKKSRFYKDSFKAGNEVIDTNMPVVSGKGPSLVDGGPLKADPLNAPKDYAGKRVREFEKYVAKKLKKEERPAMFQRLQKLAFSTSNLQSTKNLALKDERVKVKDKSTPKIIDSTTTNDSGPGSYEQLHGNKPLKIFTIAEKFERQHYSESEGDTDDEGSHNLILNQPEPSKTTQEMSRKPAFFILVNRSPAVEASRALLPVYGEEQTIMETIRNNAVSVICGETGSGKTTQVPQFLYEAGYGCPESDNPGMVGITQPRRVAAISMAKRVAFELGLSSQQHVAHHIRYDSSVSPDTRIKFMTDGILLREIASDFLLAKYSVIILDEAHERNLNTDILIGMLSRIVRLRSDLASKDEVKPLRLVIMSATLDIDEFMKPKLFNPLPPILKVDARQHPVAIHFSRRTNPDHVDSAFKMVSRIHSNLPPGGILVFLTGKQEIIELGKKLGQKYPTFSNHLKASIPSHDDEENAGPDEEGESFYQVAEEETISDDEKDKGSDEDSMSGSEFELDCETTSPLHIVPLHSLLSPEAQQRVFLPPPEGSRLCVLATNIAETSLTIPNIKYVVDCGKVKQRFYNLETGTQQYRIVWGSKASAAQRAGRAGRTGPGHCYRLFSTAVFDQQCPNFSQPEIQRVPIEALILQLKMMGIDNVSNFPLPSDPQMGAITQAERMLVKLGALVGQEDVSHKIQHRSTKLGSLMALFPLGPRWSRMLVLACQDSLNPAFDSQILPLMIGLVATLSVGNPFLDQQEGFLPESSSAQTKEALRIAKSSFVGKPATSDLLLVLSAFISFMKLGNSPKKREFCEKNQLLMKKLEEMELQYRQIVKLVMQNFSGVTPGNLPVGINRDSRDYLRKTIAESLVDRIAERTKVTGKAKSVLPAYRILTLEPSQISNDAAEANGEEELDPNIVHLHSSSCLSACPPRYLVFAESIAGERGIQLKGVTAVEPAWIPQNVLLDTKGSAQ